jgi:hypothetical protein
MNDAERAAWDQMLAWREVRAQTKPGTSQYEEADKQFKEAEMAYYRAKG